MTYVSLMLKLVHAKLDLFEIAKYLKDARYSTLISPAHTTLPTVLCNRSNGQLRTCSFVLHNFIEPVTFSRHVLMSLTAAGHCGTRMLYARLNRYIIASEVRFLFNGTDFLYICFRPYVVP